MLPFICVLSIDSIGYAVQAGQLSCQILVSFEVIFMICKKYHAVLVKWGVKCFAIIVRYSVENIILINYTVFKL